jgi:hypothetical protein
MSLCQEKLKNEACAKHGQGNAIQFIFPELKVRNMVYILVDEN